MLPKSVRLSRSGFEALHPARRVQSEHFSILFAETTTLGGSAVIVSKKTAPTSVARHALKRQVRAIIAPWSTPTRALVVTARKGATTLPFSVLHNELSTLLRSILPTPPEK